MNYEKEYKELVGKIDKAYLYAQTDSTKAVLEEIFPELKESEGERIRKEMIEILKQEAKDFPSSIIAEKSNKWIAWLEKRGKHQKFRDSIQVGDKVTRNKNGVLVNLSQLDRVAKKDNKQGEQIDLANKEYWRGYREGKQEILDKYSELEKQGEKGTNGNDREIPNSEQKPTSKVEPIEWSGKIKSRKVEGVLKKMLDEKIKSANKVEPKFKVGDIVKHKNNPHLTYILKRFTDDGDYEFHAIGKDGNEGCTCFSVVKYQDEWELVKQKPADKVEPKFKVGNWVVRELDNTCYQIKKCILNVTNNKYGYDLTSGGYISSQDANFYHLWTIEDAKDGDALVDEYGNVGIFKECEGAFWISCIYIGSDGILRGFSIGGKHENTDTHPATKEQRGLLLQKMKEFGYELKELEGRVQPQPNKAWSKEDEQKLNRIYSIIGQAADTHSFSTSCRLIGDKEAIELQEFLKGIKNGNLSQLTQEATNILIDKVCAWIKQNVNKYLYNTGDNDAYIPSCSGKMIED